MEEKATLKEKALFMLHCMFDKDYVSKLNRKRSEEEEAAKHENK